MLVQKRETEQTANQGHLATLGYSSTSLMAHLSSSPPLMALCSRGHARPARREGWCPQSPVFCAWVKSQITRFSVSKSAFMEFPGCCCPLPWLFLDTHQWKRPQRCQIKMDFDWSLSHPSPNVQLAWGPNNVMLKKKWYSKWAAGSTSYTPTPYP